MAGHAFFFGEDQARYVITVKADDADRVAVRAQAAAVPLRVIGTTGGDALALAGEPAVPLAKMRDAFEGWLPAYMAG
jgi:phosphoribosylformylglycinamidine synthase